MGKNILVEALRANDLAKGKKANNYFDYNTSLISYPTKNPIFDYYFSYKTFITDKDDKVVDEYTNLGVPAGTLCMFIGKSKTAKTAAAITFASNIVRNFDNGFVHHFDIEQSSTTSRIQSLSKFTTQQIVDGKYILRKEKLTLADLKASIVEIYNEKITNRKRYEYDSGKKDEFGNPIVLLEPTCIIIDSIAAINSGIDGKNIEELEEISSQPDKMRLAGEISRFLGEILEILRGSNITVFVINHIRKKAQMGYIKEAADIIGLNMDESLPGGLAPTYYARILVKFIVPSSNKLVEEKDGISGYDIDCKIIKSNVGISDVIFPITFDARRGISVIRSCFKYAKDNDLIGGNKNGYYFKPFPDSKFTLEHMEEDFHNNRDLYKYMMATIKPKLEKITSGIPASEFMIPEEEDNIYDI